MGKDESLHVGPLQRLVDRRQKAPRVQAGRRRHPDDYTRTRGGVRGAGGRVVSCPPMERPPDFADRLPRVVPREEEDISHLSDEMADLLYPGRRPRPFRIGIRFGAFEEPAHERAIAAAQRSPVYRVESTPFGTFHRADFDAGEARALRDLFELVRGRPGTEVLVDGKKLPHAHELWLPLFWFFLGGEA